LSVISGVGYTKEVHGFKVCSQMVKWRNLELTYTKVSTPLVVIPKGRLIVSVNDIPDHRQLIWSNNVRRFQQLLLDGIPHKRPVTWKFRDAIGL
jgi:hypothetical protein